MLMVGPHDTVPSAALKVYLQQRRIDRLRSAKRLVRWLTVAMVLVLVTMTVLRGPRLLGPPTVLTAILLAVAAWVVAVCYDVRMHSCRLDSRLCLARLEAVLGHLVVREQGQKVDSARARRAGAVVLTNEQPMELRAQVRQLEGEIDESEHRVERALLGGAVAAALGAVALGAAVVASAVAIS